MPLDLVRFKQADSTMVETYKYNYALNELTVHFNNGDTYVYEKVPVDVFNQMRVAGSTGKSFNAIIKNVYNFRKVAHQEAGHGKIQAKQKQAEA